MKHIIIGASAAGLTAAKTIRQFEADDEITVISEDTHVHSRCMLHHFLAHHRTIEQLNFVSDDFFEVNNVKFLKGEKVISVDSANSTVNLECGAQLKYDRLLIASGANYVTPPIPNFREAKNVYGLRTVYDAIKIDKAVENGGKKCVIVGSGLVGLDAAYALSERGVECSIVEMADRISPLQLDGIAASAYQTLFEKAGCKFYLEESAAGSTMDENGNINSVLLKSGKELHCDFVITAAGVRPNVEFLNESGIEVNRSVVVNEYLKTNVDNVWAAGDVAGITGIWPNAMQQGEVAAKNMCGVEVPYVDKYGMKNTMNFYGLTTLSLGINTPEEDDEVFIQQGEDFYKRLIVKEGIIKHIILQGDISNSGFWQELVKNKVSVSHIKKSLFDITYADFYNYDSKTGLFDWSK